MKKLPNRTMDSTQTYIFDLDGTLTDSALLTVEAFRLAVPGSGLPEPTIEAIWAANGYPVPEFYELIYPSFPTEKVHALGERVYETELCILPDFRWELLFPGVRELLIELKNQGKNLFIVSTGSPEHVDSLLDHSGIHCFFEAIFCGEADKAGMIGRIIGDMDPAGFLVVGDSIKDSMGAHQNGVRSVGACYGYCVQGEHDFDFYISTPAELLEIE